VLRLTPLDLNEVIRRVHAMLSRLIGERIVIRTELAEDLHPVMADASQLEQVLMNLAVNARDAMPNGGELVIRTANEERTSSDQGRAILFTVTDTGTGMSPAVQAKIFEPFFTTKERGKGTGLGLAAVHGIVAQLNGSIEVVSALDRGTTFRIQLPATAAAAATVRSTAPPGLPVGPETILLVEDEEAVRAFAATALRRVGHRVLEAASAEDALEAAGREGGPIDLLLTDVVLPNMDGRELADRIELARSGIRVVFMSGYTHLMSTADGYLEPGIQFLSKPFTAHELLTKVRQQLDPPEPRG
jgi:CheY-like chemotaxis protein